MGWLKVNQSGYELTEGEGRTKVTLSAFFLGDDSLVFLYNENAHLGAVAMGDYCHEEERSSVSVVTRLGHRDEVPAQKVALQISKQTKGAVCVVAGIHVDNITREEIARVLENVDKLAVRFCQGLE